MRYTYISKSARRHSRGLPGHRINGQSLVIVEEFCYLGDTIGARGGTADSVIRKIRRRWSKFRDLVSFVASRGLPLERKGRLYSACVHSVMLYGS